MQPHQFKGIGRSRRQVLAQGSSLQRIDENDIPFEVNPDFLLPQFPLVPYLVISLDSVLPIVYGSATLSHHRYPCEFPLIPFQSKCSALTTHVQLDWASRCSTGRSSHISSIFLRSFADKARILLKNFVGSSWAFRADSSSIGSRQHRTAERYGHSFLEYMELSPGGITMGRSEPLMDVQADNSSLKGFQPDHFPNVCWKARKRARDGVVLWASRENPFAL
jgi:hypothetical protein